LASISIFVTKNPTKCAATAWPPSCSRASSSSEALTFHAAATGNLNDAPGLAPKTPRARRSVDLPAFVVAFLRRQHKDQRERKMAFRDVWGEYGVVLDNGIGQPLSPWTVSADFRRVVHELGLPRTRFHDLRHAHATQLLASGVHVKAVSERLGHASTSFTMDTYQHVIPSMGRTAADAANQLFGEVPR
jgi:integrase